MAESTIPPLRSDPFTPDQFDGARAAYARDLFHSQDELLRARDRGIEENIRMLSGQQWIFWSDLLGKFVDLTRFLTDDERRWRQRPVINRLLYWFMLVHARLTENPPVVAFQPSSGDRKDAMLAEVMDTVFKTIWREAGMDDVADRGMSWLIPSGRVYFYSRIDPTKGAAKEWVGPATIPVLSRETGEPVDEIELPDVAFDAEGNPVDVAYDDGEIERGQPHAEYEGSIAVDVVTALEARGEWGNKPWHEKSWHCRRSYHEPAAIKASFGADVEPDTFGAEAEGAGEMERLLFGSGNFGAAEGKTLGNGAIGTKGRGAKGGLVCVYELWQAPNDSVAGMQKTGESPGGRLLIVTKKGQVLRDGPRTADFKYTSPMQALDFVNLPGRPHGTTPQEMLNPIQRTYNRGWAQILEHRNLSTNPIGLVDNAAGVQDGQITNRPGTILSVNMRAGVDPFRYVQPPQLGEDVYRVQAMLKGEMDDLGNTEGADGGAPTEDSSGELVKELRFNSDRFIGPTSRRAVGCFARVVEDWIALLPTVWDEEKIITYAGEDSVARTVAVLPEFFTGKVNVVPDIESMLPEGRGERQAKVRQWYLEGIFGQPGTPEAVNRYMELARFPHLSRAARPGGIHRITAEQENGKLIRGEAQAATLPLLRWYDDAVHLAVHYEFMASPDYLNLPVEIQQEYVLHTEGHEQAMQQKMMQQATQQAAMQAMLAPQEPGAPGGGQGGGIQAGAANQVANKQANPSLAPTPAGSKEHLPQSVK